MIWRALILAVLLGMTSTQECCDDGPISNGTLSGASRGSSGPGVMRPIADKLKVMQTPEDEVVRDIADSFKVTYELEDLRINFFNGPLDDFINITLQGMYAKYKHVDFLIIYDNDIDSLIEKNWIKPYPKTINEGAFKPTAIAAMKRGQVLYGIPLFITQDNKVKGVAVSSRVEDELLDLTITFNDTLSTVENSKRLADAAGGKTAYNIIP